MRKDTDYLVKLVSYIKENLKKGYTKESLRWALVGQGHSKLEINKAFQRAEEELGREAPILDTRPAISHEIVDPANIAVEPEEKKSFWKRLFG